MNRLVQSAIRRGPHQVLEAATLVLPTAGTVGIVGINGAGKSTLFLALAGLLPRHAGSVVLEPRSPETALGYAPQQPSFPDWLDVEGVARLYGLTWDVLERCGQGLLLEELRGKPAGALSVGQRQVFSVALALALEAPLTLLDEPFAPLDFRRRIALVRLLRQRRDQPAGGLTLISSQAAIDLLDTCAWIVVLRDGRYVFSGETRELAGAAPDAPGARERFEETVMALLDAAPAAAQG